MQLHLASVCNCYIYLYSKLQVYVTTAFGKTQLSGALITPLWNHSNNTTDL